MGHHPASGYTSRKKWIKSMLCILMIGMHVCYAFVSGSQTSLCNLCRSCTQRTSLRQWLSNLFIPTPEGQEAAQNVLSSKYI